MSFSKVLIAFGSNVGDSEAAYRRVQHELPSHGFEILAASTPLLTEPIGGDAESSTSRYLNAALLVQTTMDPDQAIEELLGIEKKLGRVRDRRWGPRTVDLDLLLFDQLEISKPQLVCPHPRMSYRRFVLEPAAEIAAEFVHPTSGSTVGQLLERLNDSSRPLVLWIGDLGEAEGVQKSVATPLGRQVQWVDASRFLGAPSEFQQAEVICPVETLESFEILQEKARLVVISKPTFSDAGLISRARKFSGGLLVLEESDDSGREVISAIDAMH